MSFASDLQSVASSNNVQMINGRTRVQAIYYVSTSSAGYLRLYDGTDGSTDPKIDLVTPASVGAVAFELPDDGVLFKRGVYMESSEIAEATLFFCGGARVDVDTGIYVAGVSASVASNGANLETTNNVDSSGSEGSAELGDITVDAQENP